MPRGARAPKILIHDVRHRYLNDALRTRWMARSLHCSPTPAGPETGAFPMATSTLSASPLEILAERFSTIRAFTEKLCEGLATEDFVVQSMPDVSPTKWHLAHTSWFFETFALARWEVNYRPFSTDYQFLFNSYYNSVGEQFPRTRRGLLTRPTVADVFEYRHAVD